jgi:hypothetical protein
MARQGHDLSLTRYALTWLPKRRQPSRHCVRTATLVDPRVTPPSLKRTKMRFCAGSNGTGGPVPATKIPKVGVAPALIVVVTLLAGAPRHVLSAGFV